MCDYFSTKQLYLETERFVLRPFKMEDLNDFYEYSKVDGVFESAGMRHCQTIEDSKKRLEKYLYMENRFAVVDKDSKKVIGEVQVIGNGYFPGLPTKIKTAILCFILSKEYWGRGYMVEAANAVISLLFDRLDYEGIVAWHASDNNRSQRVIEKLGFTRLGRCSFKTDFGMVDGFEYGLLNKDWLVGRDI